VTHKRYAVVGLFGAFAALGASALGTPANATTASTPAGTDRAEVSFGSAAACVGRNAVSTHEVFVDGVSVGWGINKTLIQGGSNVKVAFTVAAGCDPVQFGLAVYSNPSDSADPTYDDVMKQTYATSAVVTKSAGELGTLELDLPQIADCFYQVDFFTGPVIQKFGPDYDNFYGSPEDRLIAADHIEIPNCAEVAETTTTVRPETTTTSTTSTTSTSTSTTSTTTGEEVLPDDTDTPSGRAEVLGEVVENDTTDTTQPAEVLAESLAATGGSELTLVGIASAFALAGGTLTVAANAVRRRRTS
jgi:hypothetical protein